MAEAILSLDNGRLAQLGEHLPYKQGVIGSSPIVPTIKYSAYALYFFCAETDFYFYIQKQKTLSYYIPYSACNLWDFKASIFMRGNAFSFMVIEIVNGGNLCYDFS